MTPLAWMLLLFYLLILLVLAWPVGRLLTALVEGSVPAPLRRVESLLLGRYGQQEMDWRGYALCILFFNLIGVVLLFAILLLQGALPFNPQHLPGMSVDLAFNTAISFMTNTNWQAYSGESAVSYFSQMAGLTVQNFLSAASGGAVALVLIRSLSRHSGRELGNAWLDLLRLTLYVLLPVSLLLALCFIQQGALQNLLPYLDRPPWRGANRPWPWGRLPPRRPSRCWAPMGVASLMPTRPTPLKIPPP